MSGRREKGTGSIFKKGDHYYLRVRTGNTAKVSVLRDKNGLPITNQKEAQKAAVKLRPILLAEQKEELILHLELARKMKNKVSVPIEGIWENYLRQSSRPDSGDTTLLCYEKSAKRFVKWLNENQPEVKFVEQITQQVAESYFFDMWQSHVSARTYNAHRQALRLIFKYIWRNCGLEENPFSTITRKSGRMISRQEFSEEQVQAIFSGFKTGFFYYSEQERLDTGRQRIRKIVKKEFIPMNKNELEVLLNLCCWTGCRGQDGCVMTWESVDLNKNLITYVPQKTARKTSYKSVSLPIHPNLRSVLLMALEWRNENRSNENYILPNIAHRFQYNSSGVQKDVMKVIRCATGCQTTGVITDSHRVKNPNIYSLHSFRHTFVSFCANAGVSLDIVASIVGHGSSAMTRHYAHISQEAKKNAINLLPILKTEDPSRKEVETLKEKIESLSEDQIKKLLSQIA